MPYLLFLKKRQNLKWSSAANYRWRLMGYEPRHLPCGIEAPVFRAHHDVPRALRTLNFIQAPRTLHLNAVCDVRSATGV